MYAPDTFQHLSLQYPNHFTLIINLIFSESYISMVMGIIIGPEALGLININNWAPEGDVSNK